MRRIFVVFPPVTLTIYKSTHATNYFGNVYLNDFITFDLINACNKNHLLTFKRELRLKHYRNGHERIGS